MITMFLLYLVCCHNMVLCNTVLIIWYSIAILYGNIVILYGTILTILSACGGFLSSRKSVAPRSVTPFFQNAPFGPPQPPKNATAAQPLSACCREIILSFLVLRNIFTEQCTSACLSDFPPFAIGRLLYKHWKMEGFPPRPFLLLSWRWCCW
jgi:hypothetical protein